jgi:hypothetical protein
MTDPDAPDARPTRPRWRGPVVWGLVISIALVAYELTAQPALAVVTVSLKMGWERFATAVWLLRRDPNRPRGWACFWLYVGSGFWVAAVTGFALFLLIPFVLPNQPAAGFVNKPGDPVVSAFIGSAIAWVAGTSLAAVCFLYAAILAWRRGFRLWLHPDVGRAKDRGEWPPWYGHENRAWFPVTVSVVFLFITVAVVLAVVACAVWAGAGWAVPQGPASGLVTLLVLATVLLTAMKVIDVLRSRVYARWPSECWTARPEV